jgi:hypothetical protein
LRDVEDLLAERGAIVSREEIRHWCIKFGKIYTRRLKKNHKGFGGTFFLDEVFVKINGKQHYLWRAVDQDGEVVNVDGLLNQVQYTQPEVSYRSSWRAKESQILIVCFQIVFK